MSETDPTTTVVYYSKSGHSHLAAQRVASALGATQYRLQTNRYGMPFLGYLRAGLDSLRQTRPPLTGLLPDLTGCDSLVICGPIWTSYPAAPLCSYLDQAANLPPVIGLLLTCGDHSPPEKAIALVESKLGRPLAATGAIPNKLENTAEGQKRLDDFIAATQQAIASHMHAKAG